MRDVEDGTAWESTRRVRSLLFAVLLHGVLALMLPPASVSRQGLRTVGRRWVVVESSGRRFKMGGVECSGLASRTLHSQWGLTTVYKKRGSLTRLTSPTFDVTRGSARKKALNM